MRGRERIKVRVINQLGMREGSLLVEVFASETTRATEFEKENVMHNNKELCEKIRSLYPAIGECGIDVDVAYDERKKAYVVDLKQGQHELKTHLEPTDADACMEGRQCVYLGTQIAQLVANIKRRA